MLTMLSLLLGSFFVAGNPVDLPPSDICEAVAYEVRDAVEFGILDDRQAFEIEMRCLLNYS